jgi:hypothetical protein
MALDESTRKIYAFRHEQTHPSLEKAHSIYKTLLLNVVMPNRSQLLNPKEYLTDKEIYGYYSNNYQLENPHAEAVTIIDTITNQVYVASYLPDDIQKNNVRLYCLDLKTGNFTAKTHALDGRYSSGGAKFGHILSLDFVDEKYEIIYALSNWFTSLNAQLHTNNQLRQQLSSTLGYLRSSNRR